jgi:hypothetical protein
VPVLKHIKTHILGKRPIDQIGVLSESSQLMILSGMLRLASIKDA